MKFTNSLGVHPFIAKSMQGNPHPKRNEEHRFASVTELLNPTQQTILRWRHEDEIVQDAIDLWDMWLGTCMHEAIHQAAQKMGKKVITEERRCVDVGGRKVTGGLDAGLTVEDGSGLWVADFKFVKAFALVMKSSFDHWEKQLNTYAYMLRVAGHKVSRITIEAYLKYWYDPASEYGKRQIGQKNLDKYPKAPYQSIPFELYPDAKILKWLTERCDAIETAEKLADGELPHCSGDERWLRPNGDSLRCQEFCDVAPFCAQWKELKP